MIGNRSADKIMKVLKNLEPNNSETVTNKDDKEIPKERYISPEKTQEIIGDLRSKIINLIDYKIADKTTTFLKNFTTK